MMVDVVTAAFAIVPLALVRVPEPDGPAAGQARPSLLRQVVEGFAFLRDRPGHLRIVLLAGVVNLFIVPAFSLLPLFVSGELHGSAGVLASLNAAFGVGMIAGGVVLGAWGGFRPRVVTSLVGLIGLGLAVFALGRAPAGHTWWPIAAMFGVGWMIPTVNGPILAVLQATVAPSMQGRIFTLITSLATLAAPLGLAAAAPIAELLGVRTWYMAGAVASVLMGLSGFFSRPVLRIEEAPEPAAGVVEESAAG